MALGALENNDKITLNDEIKVRFEYEVCQSDWLGMINFDQPDLSTGNFYIDLSKIMFFLLVCKKLKVLPMFPGGPSEMIEDIQKVSCPSELTEGQNKTIQVWDLNHRISLCPMT